MHRVVAPTHLSRKPPETPDGQIPWQFQAFYGGLESQDPGSFVLEIPRGRVVGRGAVITPDDQLLGDVSREFIIGGDQANHSVFQRLRLGRRRWIDGSVAVLASTDSDGYWHWFIDVLARVILLRAVFGSLQEIESFYLNPLRHAFQTETLTRLGVPLERAIFSDSNVQIEAANLVVPSIFHSVPNRWACEQLAASFSPSSPSTERGTRLYVSRSDAKLRRVVNEDDLTGWLHRQGFQIVTLQNRTVSEQQRLFRQADVIMAPHGAALTNLLFCRPGTRVIEIFPPTYVNPCYWVLACHRQLPYACLQGDGFLPPAPPAGQDPKQWFHSFTDADAVLGRDIRVRMDETLGWLERVLQTSPSYLGSLPETPGIHLPPGG